MKARIPDFSSSGLDFITLYLALHLMLEYDFSDIADADVTIRNAALAKEVIKKLESKDMSFHANHLRVMSVSLDILEGTADKTGIIPEHMTRGEVIRKISLNRNIIHKHLLDMGIDIDEG